MPTTDTGVALSPAITASLATARPYTFGITRETASFMLDDAAPV